MKAHIFVFLLVQITVYGGPTRGHYTSNYYANPSHIGRKSTSADESAKLCIPLKGQVICAKNAKDVPVEYKKFFHSVSELFNMIPNKDSSGISYQYYDEMWRKAKDDYADFDSDFDSLKKTNKLKPINHRAIPANLWRNMPHKVAKSLKDIAKEAVQGKRPQLIRLKTKHLFTKLPAGTSKISYQYYDDAWTRADDSKFEFIDIDDNYKDNADRLNAPTKANDNGILRSGKNEQHNDHDRSNINEERFEEYSDKKEAFGDNYDALMRRSLPDTAHEENHSESLLERKREEHFLPLQNLRKEKSNKRQSSLVENVIDEYLESNIDKAKTEAENALNTGYINKEKYDNILLLIKRAETSEFRNMFQEDFGKMLDDQVQAAIEHGKKLLVSRQVAGEISKESFDSKLNLPNLLNIDDVKVKAVKILIKSQFDQDGGYQSKSMIPVNQEEYLIRKLIRDLKYNNPLTERQKEYIYENMVNNWLITPGKDGLRKKGKRVSRKLLPSKRGLWIDGISQGFERQKIIDPWFGKIPKSYDLWHGKIPKDNDPWFGKIPIINDPWFEKGIRNKNYPWFENEPKLNYNGFEIFCSNGYCKILY